MAAAQELLSCGKLASARNFKVFHEVQVTFSFVLNIYVGHTKSNEQQFFYKLKFVVM
jgi:hypothetical protein